MKRALISPPAALGQRAVAGERLPLTASYR
jgi:hypothetical protein